MHKNLRSHNFGITSLLLLSALVIVGCSDDDPPADGTVVQAEADAGAESNADAGNVNETDSGTVTGSDAGTGDVGNTDAGTDPGGDVNDTDADPGDVSDTDAGTGDVDDTDAGTVTATDAGGVTATDAGGVTATDAGDIDGTDAGGIDGTDSGDIAGTDTGAVTGTDAGDGTDGTDVGTTDTGTSVDDGDSSPITVGAAGCAALSGKGSTASIAGLYDLSETFEDLLDVYYLEISEKGAVTFYDYEQDSFGSGENCYLIDSGYSAISPLGGNEYEVNYYDDPDTDCEIVTEQNTIVRTETELTVSYIDTFDDDEDGDTTDLFSDSFPVATGLSSESFESCE